MDIEKLSESEKRLLEELASAQGVTVQRYVADNYSSPDPTPAPAVAEPVQVTSTLEEGDELEVTAEDPWEAANPADLPDLPPPAPAAEEEPPQPSPDSAGFETGDSSIPICSQCGWDQRMPTIAEPDHSDKMRFLQAVLGGKLFSKSYKVFDGNLKIGFRVLTVREIDAIYSQTFKAQSDGLIQTTTDYWEYINRLRLFLQLNQVSTQSIAGTHTTLPDGLSDETSPDANLTWEAFLRKENLLTDEPLTLQLEQYLQRNVLKTETVQRIVTNTCNQFNRLVTKLELCVDTPDFWKETEQPH